MPTPFIQLFKTPRGRYVFDANQNEILSVSEESFDFLSSCLAGTQEIESCYIPEIDSLKSKGYLRTKSVVEDISHPYTPFLADFLTRKLSHITLQITQQCNLRCKYCVYSEEVNQRQRSHSSKRMSWNTAKHAIDFLYDHSVDSDKIAIGFYGGEPLLELPLIKRIVAYSKSLFAGKELLFAMTTNGTLLSDDTIKFLAKEKIQMMISLDGPREIHDQNRVFASGGGSFDRIMQNMARIREIAPEYYEQVQFSMVMDPSNDFDCINEVNLYVKDFDAHSLTATVVEKEYDDIATSYSEQYVWKYEYHRFLALLSALNRFPKKDVSAISYDEATLLFSDAKKIESSGPLHQVDAPGGPCITGQLRLFVNADGLLFPCERVSEKSKAMCIGTLGEGFYVEKASKLLNVGAISKNTCKHCWCIRHCTACAKTADSGTENLSSERKLLHCNQIRANVYMKLRQYILLQEAGVFYAEQLCKRGEENG